MECMCAQTRSQFILSSKRALGEWSQQLQGKNSLYRQLKGGSKPRRCITQDSKTNTLHTVLSQCCIIQSGPRRPVSEMDVACCWNADQQQSARGLFVCLFVGCLTSQQQASVSQGRICSDNFTCCHTEIEVADQTFYLTQSHYTDTGPTSPSADPITPGAWQGSHWSANF